MSVISMKQLLEAGVHFGHQTRRWNPKMAPYIYTERNGIYIIDLQTKLTMQSETVLLTEERFFSLVLRNRLRILSRTKLRDVECTM